MGMTLPQKKYFCNRIDEECSRKIQRETLERPDKESYWRECLDSGKVKLYNFSQINQIMKNKWTCAVSESWSYGSSNSIDWKNLTTGSKSAIEKYDEMVDEIEEKNRKNSKKIQDEATKIKDQAMFGNEQEAHEMLRLFIGEEQ